MTLTFSLLIVDDNPDLISGAIKLLRTHLREKGFRLKCHEMLIDSVTASSPLNYESGAYDLAIIDFNLGNPTKDGVVEAKQFRNQNLYNEMIFYSGQEELSDLRSLLSEAAVDGVFLSSRDNLGDALTGVADIIIGKLTNINFMRGIAMAEVAEIDMKILTTLIDFFHDDSYAEIQDLTARMKEKFQKKRGNDLKGLKKRFENQTLLRILRDGRTISSAEVCRLIGWINKEIKVLDQESYQDIDYVGKVLNPRNILAHCVEERVEGHPSVLRSINTERPSTTIDEEWMVNYRNTLLETKEKIESICDTLRQNLLRRDAPDDA